MEVLLVLVILVALGAIAVPIYGHVRKTADINLAKVQVRMLEQAIDTYQLTTNRLPDELSELMRRPTDARRAASWQGPVLKESQSLDDPWEEVYQYSAQGVKNVESYDVWSMGPDRTNGSMDDIGNWEG
jgi:general secretion pathway protein G